MYGKIFDSMYDGTIASNWKGLVTFQQMIVLCDSNGVIDMTPPALSRRTGIPIDIILEGIDFLESPDPYSRSQEAEGRRIVRIDEHRAWGWIIVNHKKYKTMVSKSAKSEYDRDRYRKRKEQGKVKKVKSNEKQVKKVKPSSVPQCSTDSTHADADAYTDKRKNTTMSSCVAVFDYWKSELNHPNAKMDDKRKRIIARALKVGYTVDDLKSAIRGCKKSSFHMGKNDRNRKFDGVDLIFRDADNIDSFVEIDTGKKPVGDKIRRNGFAESDYKAEM